ncbi:MAG: maltose alpha-D-glucosyltransferase, partial [Dermatophilaceae bacterium]
MEHGLAELHPHKPSEITFDEQYYPARPRHLRPKARLRGAQFSRLERLGEPVGSNPAYVAWLQEESMLGDANVIARQFSGQGSMFQNPFAKPDPRSAIQTASVWFTAYPISVLGKPGSSFLATLGDPELWKVFRRIGIQGLHTGPVKRAGGIRGWSPTPSV